MKTAQRWRSFSISVTPTLRLTAISLGGYAALRLIELTGPTGNIIEVNPQEIVTIREPYAADKFNNNVHCVIYTSDGRLVGAQETCEHIKQMLKADD